MEGELTAQMPVTGIVARLAISPVRTGGCDISRWRLVLKLSEPTSYQQAQNQTPSGMPSTVDSEMAELMPRFEEFFDRRVSLAFQVYS